MPCILFCNLFSVALGEKKLPIYIYDAYLSLYHSQLYYKVAVAATQWAWGQMMFFCALQRSLEANLVDAGLFPEIGGCIASHNTQNCQKSFWLWDLSKLKLFWRPRMISRCLTGPKASILLTLWGLQCWNTLQKLDSSPFLLTHPLVTVCFSLLDLVVALAKSYLVLVCSVWKTPVQAY